ncbi:related to ARG81 - transcription factor involved in arginine metabolism [Cephalotrichum gorgonifer]|uniref:Related to ARG81 - transcription factor involved in arginine metabolism n=1 Tax=Cephalotrichum gorgonifer TaxID=2041049 RepID=A0AAE8MX04_9PEZI|nr:related to ARG81 - transcription factor involved in arginine metabolism [Cephalotrichum gorgonifer]
MNNSQYSIEQSEYAVVDTRRTRSFNGCVTCRGRRMKCDEAQPKCTTCRMSGITCGGYAKTIFFEFEDAPDFGPARFRRPLLTEKERECMSREMTSEVPPASAMWHIARIDEECDNTPESKNLQLSRGPFGAFRISSGCRSLIRALEPAPTESVSPPDECSPDTDVYLEDSYVDLDEALFVHPDVSALPQRAQSDRLRVRGLGDETANSVATWWPTDSWSTLADPVSISVWWQDPAARSCQQDTSAHEYWMPDLEQVLTTPLPVGDIVEPTTALPINALQSPIREASSLPLSLDYSIPHDAILLLKHYSTTVLQSLTPYRHSKTPWHILFIPHAKSCLAAITLGEDMDHAGLCAFFGMLAISASSLGVISGSERWFARSSLLGEHARAHASLMLRTAYDVPKAAKYKSILMALLTMVQLSSVSGDRDETERYFLEAEKFIRVKGLNRRKSRKVRLLHHCYVFERILYETTFSGSPHSRLRRDVRKAIVSCGAKAYSKDSLSFKCLDWGWGDLEQQMRTVKGKDVGEDDLHVQLPGIWSATLYPEIFGVPETYIFLLSLVIRLERSRHDAKARPGSVGLDEYLTRAKAVESCIQRLRRRPECVAIEATEDPERQNCQRLLRTLATAMQQALTIYFYRRVYDVDRSMLQSNVIAVRDCLRSFEEESGGAGYGEARLVWPACIAVSEAEDGAVKEEIQKWFDGCGRRSGFRMLAGFRADSRPVRGGMGGVELGQVIETQA